MDQLKIALILLSITWKMLSASKLGVLLMDQVLILRDQIWTIKLDFRKDQRILINKYLMTFKPFSSFCTDKLVAILAIFNYPWFVCTNSWNFQIWWFWVKNFSRKSWKWLKSHDIVVNQNSLIFPKIQPDCPNSVPKCHFWTN